MSRRRKPERSPRSPPPDNRFGRCVLCRRALDAHEAETHICDDCVEKEEIQE